VPITFAYYSFKTKRKACKKICQDFSLLCQAFITSFHDYTPGFLVDLAVFYLAYYAVNNVKIAAYSEQLVKRQIH